MNNFMYIAQQTAKCGIEHGHGGPFGAVIVNNGRIVATAHNEVLSKNDPTCHGEINAIRIACSELETYDLSGCVLYTTGEPCTMCLCACMWANIDKIYYACSIQDNASIGFRDEKFDGIFGRDKLPDGYLVQIDRDEVYNNLFVAYQNMEKTNY